jgi:hypothetical protein
MAIYQSITLEDIDEKLGIIEEKLNNTIEKNKKNIEDLDLEYMAEAVEKNELIIEKMAETILALETRLAKIKAVEVHALVHRLEKCEASLNVKDDEIYALKRRLEEYETTVSVKDIAESLDFVTQSVLSFVARLEKIEKTEIGVDEMAKTILELGSRIRKLERICYNMGVE